MAGIVRASGRNRLFDFAVLRGLDALFQFLDAEYDQRLPADDALWLPMVPVLLGAFVFILAMALGFMKALASLSGEPDPPMPPAS